MVEHNFAQVIHLLTQITDHSAIVIDHIYSNEVHNIVKTRVVTMDISKHLGTYIQFAASPNSSVQNVSKAGNPLTEFINFRKFNASNMNNFSELVGGESWVAVDEAKSADEKYEHFLDTYNKHYNDAFNKL